MQISVILIDVEKIKLISHTFVVSVHKVSYKQVNVQITYIGMIVIYIFVGKLVVIVRFSPLHKADVTFHEKVCPLLLFEETMVLH